MNILVIGSGGREHVLAWKLAEPDSVTQVFHHLFLHLPKPILLLRIQIQSLLKLVQLVLLSLKLLLILIHH